MLFNGQEEDLGLYCQRFDSKRRDITFGIDLVFGWKSSKRKQTYSSTLICKEDFKS